MTINFSAELRAEKKTLELSMYDFIGSDFFGDGITDKMVQRALDGAPNVELIHIRMNSPGGDAFMGFAIANLLAQHPARKEIDLDGLCASIATAIAMQCDEIRMGAGSQMMIHEASAIMRGTAAKMRSRADSLEGLNTSIAEMYVKRTGKPMAEIRALMDAESWFTPAKAVEIKLADKVVGAPAAATKMSAQLFAGLDRLGFRNMPNELRVHAEAQQQIVQEKPRMEDSLKAFLATLGLATAQDVTARLGALTKLESVIGNSGDEAHGVLLAWKRASTELETANAELTKLRSEKDESDLSAALHKAKDEKRHLPARETDVRKLLADKEVTMKGAIANIAAWGTVPALVAAGDGAQSATAPGATASADEEPKHNGKGYAELSGRELAALKKGNPELYAAMVAYSKRGLRNGN